jgi:peptide/nickel transport system substrate-binding protein
MRTDRPPFDDVRVRQALALAVDREQLRKTLYAGHATVGDDTVFAPAFPVSPEREPRAHDPEKARELLAQAGHPRGFKATLSTERASEIPQQAALYQQAWKAIGVDVALDVQTQAAYYGSGKDQPWLEVPLGLVDWAGRAIPSQFLIPAYTSDGIWNSAHYHDADFDRLVAAFNGELDTSRRKALAARIAEKQSTDVPAILAVFTDTSRVYSTKIKGPIAQQSNYLDLAKVSLDA